MTTLYKNRYPTLGPSCLLNNTVEVGGRLPLIHCIWDAEKSQDFIDKEFNSFHSHAGFLYVAQRLEFRYFNEIIEKEKKHETKCLIIPSTPPPFLFTRSIQIAVIP